MPPSSEPGDTYHHRRHMNYLRRTPEVGEYFRNLPGSTLLRRLKNTGGNWNVIDVETLEVFSATRVDRFPVICDEYGTPFAPDGPVLWSELVRSNPEGDGYLVGLLGFTGGTAISLDDLRTMHEDIGAHLAELDE